MTAEIGGLGLYRRRRVVPTRRYRSKEASQFYLDRAEAKRRRKAARLNALAAAGAIASR